MAESQDQAVQETISAVQTQELGPVFARAVLDVPNLSSHALSELIRKNLASIVAKSPEFGRQLVFALAEVVDDSYMLALMATVCEFDAAHQDLAFDFVDQYLKTDWRGRGKDATESLIRHLPRLVVLNKEKGFAVAHTLACKNYQLEVSKKLPELAKVDREATFKLIDTLCDNSGQPYVALQLWELSKLSRAKAYTDRLLGYAEAMVSSEDASAKMAVASQLYRFVRMDQAKGFNFLDALSCDEDKDVIKNVIGQLPLLAQLDADRVFKIAENTEGSVFKATWELARKIPELAEIDGERALKLCEALTSRITNSFNWRPFKGAILELIDVDQERGFALAEKMVSEGDGEGLDLLKEEAVRTRLQEINPEKTARLKRLIEEKKIQITPGPTPEDNAAAASSLQAALVELGLA